MSAGRNSIRDIIKIHSRQSARGRRGSQDEIDRRQFAKGKWEREQRVIHVFDKDQVDADH